MIFPPKCDICRTPPCSNSRRSDIPREHAKWWEHHVTYILALFRVWQWTTTTIGRPSKRQHPPPNDYHRFVIVLFVFKIMKAVLYFPISAKVKPRLKRDSHQILLTSHFIMFFVENINDKNTSFTNFLYVLWRCWNRKVTCNIFLKLQISILEFLLWFVAAGRRGWLGDGLRVGPAPYGCACCSCSACSTPGCGGEEFLFSKVAIDTAHCFVMNSSQDMRWLKADCALLFGRKKISEIWFFFTHELSY